MSTWHHVRWRHSAAGTCPPARWWVGGHRASSGRDDPHRSRRGGQRSSARLVEQPRVAGILGCEPRDHVPARKRPRSRPLAAARLSWLQATLEQRRRMKSDGRHAWPRGPTGRPGPCGHVPESPHTESARGCVPADQEYPVSRPPCQPAVVPALARRSAAQIRWFTRFSRSSCRPDTGLGSISPSATRRSRSSSMTPPDRIDVPSLPAQPA